MAHRTLPFDSTILASLVFLLNRAESKITKPTIANIRVVSVSGCRRRRRQCIQWQSLMATRFLSTFATRYWHLVEYTERIAFPSVCTDFATLSFVHKHRQIGISCFVTLLLCLWNNMWQPSLHSKILPPKQMTFCFEQKRGMISFEAASLADNNSEADEYLLTPYKFMENKKRKILKHQIILLIIVKVFYFLFTKNWKTQKENCNTSEVTKANFLTIFFCIQTGFNSFWAQAISWDLWDF